MTEIGSKLGQIRRVFDIDKVLARNSDNINEIARYYKKNQLAYKIFNSHKGFVHMGISQNGAFSVHDFYAQTNLVQQSINTLKAKDVLELAPGKAANIRYLAGKDPDVTFYGLDLEHGQFKVRTSRPNIHLLFGDYHNLAMFKDSSMDVVYVIEALCHAADKRQVITEVHRVLRPDGHLVIIDGYFAHDLNKLAEEQQLACRLVAKSMMVTEKDQSYGTLTNILQNERFKLEHSTDYSRNIMPSLVRLENTAKHLINHPKLAKPIIKFAGDIVATNAIAGYLMPTCVEQGLFEYRYTLAIKAA